MSMVADAGSGLLAPADREKASAIATALRRAARKSRVPVMSISGGGGFRARKSDKLFWAGIIGSFLLIALAPITLVSLYFGVYATDQFSSETRMALRTGEASLLDGLAGIPGLPASQQGQDTQILTNYMMSREMVERINEQLDLRKIYSRPDADWWARFDPSKKIEDLEKYWRSRVDAGLDSQLSIITLQVRAFSPQEALAITTKIIEIAEEKVNRLTERAREDALRDAKTEMARSEARLTDAELALRDARNKTGVIVGEATSRAIDQVLAALRIELARMQRDLAVLLKSVRPDAPQVRILKRQIDNVNAQIVEYMSQIGNTSADGSATLADRMATLSHKQSELEVAQKLYASSAVNYESARIDSETRHGYLIPFMKPTLAQKSLYPRRWLNWSLITFPALLLWAVLVGLAVLVRDHMAG